MTVETKTPYELEELFSKADKQLEAARKNIVAVKEFVEKYSEINQNLEELEAFYHSETWMQGHEELYKLFPDKNFESAGEDSIWDVSQEFYYLKIKLLRMISDDFYKIIPDYYHKILENKND